jgi:putative ABC transport system ATP-binding protein
MLFLAIKNLVRDLSGREKQRVAIARSLANDPRLIPTDEPTANMDAKTGQDVTLLLCETACRENRAAIIVSHDQRLRTAAKRVIHIEDGRLTAEETGDHSRRHPGMTGSCPDFASVVGRGVDGG